MPEAQAKAALAPLKVKVTVQRQFVDQTSDGAVLAQRPAKGVKVKEHGTVRLTVSRGPPPVAVPDLAGLDKQAATAKLEGANFKLGAVSAPYNEQVQAGLVLSWAHKGEQVPKHTPIDLVVSGGPAPRIVPDESGKTFDQAAADLQRLGLAPVRADAFNDTVPKDKVISTSPGAGASVAKGGRVAVTVSKGPDVVAVPDVSGKNVQDATAVMQQAGLSVANVFGPPNKKVFVTDPPAGQQVHRGSSVNLYTR
jgi:serine/threonine-protein kinase